MSFYTFLSVPALPPTKGGKPRLGKRTHSEGRQRAVIAFWYPLRIRIRQALAGGFTAAEMAKAIGIHPSAIHRYTCDECNHDVEPSYSLGMSLKKIIDQWEAEQRRKANASYTRSLIRYRAREMKRLERKLLKLKSL